MNFLRLSLLVTMSLSLVLAGCGGGGGGGATAPAPGVSSEAQALQQLSGGYFGSAFGNVTIAFTIAADGNVTDFKNDGQAVNLAGKLSAESLSRGSWRVAWSDGSIGIMQILRDGPSTYLMYTSPVGIFALLQKGASVLPLSGFQMTDLTEQVWEGPSMEYDANVNATTAVNSQISIQKDAHYVGTSSDGLRFGTEVGAPLQLSDGILGLFGGSFTHPQIGQAGVTLIIMSPDKKCIATLMMAGGNNIGFTDARFSIMLRVITV